VVKKLAGTAPSKKIPFAENFGERIFVNVNISENVDF
jgi:hypothetical protein